MADISVKINRPIINIFSTRNNVVFSQPKPVIIVGAEKHKIVVTPNKQMLNISVDKIITGTGVGDMRKNEYDIDNNSIVDKSQSVTNVYTCGETINAGRVVVLIGNKLFKADKDNLNHLGKVVGVSAQAGDENSEIIVVNKGVVALSVVAGNQYWLGDDGMITTVIPTTGFAQRVGYAISNTHLYVDLGEPIRRT